MAMSSFTADASSDQEPTPSSREAKDEEPSTGQILLTHWPLISCVITRQFAKKTCPADVPTTVRQGLRVGLNLTNFSDLNSDLALA